MRIAAIMLGHRFSDALRMLAEHSARKIGVLARAMAHGAAIGIDAQHFGITRRQPARRRRRRRAHDGLDASLAQHIYGAVEQIEVERPLMRLDNMPGEFRKSRRVEARGSHAVGVALPIALIDMLRVMRGTDEESVGRDRPPDRERRGFRGSRHSRKTPGDSYLMEPAVRPPCQNRCSSRNTTMTGMMLTS